MTDASELSNNEKPLPNIGYSANGFPSVIDQLVVLDEAALARVWCDLNCWEWPADLAAESKPVWWDGTGFTEGRILSDRKMGLNHLVMAHIEAHVGEGAIQAAWMQKITPAVQKIKRSDNSDDAGTQSAEDTQ